MDKDGKNQKIKKENCWFGAGPVQMKGIKNV
jgi:hypothetical protein